jgi:hypothetical protein
VILTVRHTTVTKKVVGELFYYFRAYFSGIDNFAGCVTVLLDGRVIACSNKTPFQPLAWGESIGIDTFCVGVPNLVISSIMPLLLL